LTTTHGLAGSSIDCAVLSKAGTVGVGTTDGVGRGGRGVGVVRCGVLRWLGGFALTAPVEHADRTNTAISAAAVRAARVDRTRRARAPPRLTA
jgi:hypothetical protein